MTQATDDHLVVCMGDDWLKLQDVVQNWSLVNRFGPLVVARPQGDDGLAELLRTSSLAISQRVLDRYHLVCEARTASERWPRLCDHFFDFVASEYDRIVDQARNIRNIENLFRLLEDQLGEIGDRRIVDFGCGTGLSMLVRSDANLIGVDRCERMLTQARERGMVTVGPKAFDRMPNGTFPGAFSSYVLHFLLPPIELGRLWAKIAPGGLYVANFHKSEGVEEATRVFEALGAESSRLSLEGNDGAHGPYLGFRKLTSRRSFPLLEGGSGDSLASLRGGGL